MKRKAIAVLCAVGMLVPGGAIPVMAEEHVDVETLEREAQAAENVSAEAEGEFSYKDLKGLTFAFSSGAGAWGTILTIQEDGSFEGNYHDANMGDIGEGYPNGSVYICEFSGKFTEPKKEDDFTYSAKIESITYEQEPGTSEIVDGMQRLYSEPYGLENSERFLFYLEGAPVAELPEGYRSWVGYYDMTEIQDAALPFVGLYNEAQEEGFSSFREENTETTEPETTGIDAELEAIEAQAAEIEKKADGDADQATINMSAEELYTLWDNELNSMWARIKEILPEDTFAALTEEQLAWIADKEASVAAAVAEIGGSSMSASVEFGRGASITRERVYELAEYLR